MPRLDDFLEEHAPVRHPKLDVQHLPRSTAAELRQRHDRLWSSLTDQRHRGTSHNPTGTQRWNVDPGSAWDVVHRLVPIWHLELVVVEELLQTVVRVFGLALDALLRL